MKKIVFQLIYLIMRFFGSRKIKPATLYFESFFGKQFSDNPKSILDEILKQSDQQNPKRIFIGVSGSLVPAMKKKYPEAIILRRFSLKWLYWVSVSEFWVTNVRLPLWFAKNKGTTYVQTWHGTPLKKIGLDIEEVNIHDQNTKTYHEDFKKETERWDVLVCPNPFAKKIFRQAFDYKGKTLDIGYPRNDKLIHANTASSILKLKDQLGLPVDHKIVLYAPTWRDDLVNEDGSHTFDLPFQLSSFFETAGMKTTLILRPHYLVKDAIEITGYEKNVRILSEVDISDLYLVSDCLVTDYSSVFFDYSLLNRPILFFPYDLSKYRDELRGFYLDYYNDLPGELFQTEETFLSGLNSTLESIDSEIHFPAQDSFYRQYSVWEKGTASENVAKFLLN
ncbi:MAG: CDP-glycerol glycerophosphotransferase family protein [Streptococcaceae bacterium]|jgi:CDP-glycerol glycerophosphotransferase|nr:CDP-glycerol glycerophosphotransferase family protein [Streptococcaceae bacterium]